MAPNNEICRFVSSAEELDGLLSANGYVAKREMVNVLYLALRLEKASPRCGKDSGGKGLVSRIGNAIDPAPML